MAKRATLALFFLSGCTSLIYELVFHKLLGYVFGNSTLAATTVLVAYMGGLSLGGRLIGARADAVRRPLALYGWLELGIGIYVLVVPALLQLCMRFYASVGVSSDVHELSHVLLRFALSAIILVPPTLCMGGTLPLLARALTRADDHTERDLSRLYAVNVLGATAGTLLASYALLPYLGITGTLIVGAATNVGITLCALRLDRALPTVPLSEAFPEHTASPNTDQGAAAFRLALVAAFAAGAVSFSFELVWTHLLSTIVGMSVYAFGLMLATFLGGLALGGLLVARWPRWQKARPESVALLQLGLGAVVIASLSLWDDLPFVFARVGVLQPSWMTMELTRAGVCASMLLVPCTLIGATFPLLLGSAAFEPARIGARVGLLYALNTLGCIAGALATGFWLLSALGSRRLLLACAFASLAIGVAHAALSRRSRSRCTIAAAGFAMALVVLSAYLPAWDWKALAAGMNVNFSPGALISEVLWSREDPAGGITTVTRERRGLTLRTNGKFQADDRTELTAQRGFALIPLLLVKRYGNALNIGYGSGMTAGVLSRFPFERIEVAELSPAMVEAADGYFSHINFSAQRDQRSHIVYNDGRNHLLVSRRVYDLITVEITSIWFAGAASLYGQEFYTLCREHLAPGGILQQWVQLHHITRRDLLVLWNTLRSVFPYVSLWRQGTQAALIATLEPQVIDYAHVVAMNELPAASAVKRALPTPNFLSLLNAQVLDAAGMDEILEELPEYVPKWLVPYAVSRDAYPYLEYSTPRGYALPDSAEQENLQWIMSHAHGRRPMLHGIAR